MEKEGFRVVGSHAITNGAMAQASDDETVGTYFNYIHKIITEAVAKAGLTLSDIDWIVPQNTNVTAWQILARLLPFDQDRIFLGTIADIGHIISSDNLVNLRHMDDAGMIRSGERLLLVMAGFGLNWQALILEKV
jgi:3-oxoacyl-[acyl-carrier-protein] synthase-3